MSFFHTIIKLFTTNKKLFYLILLKYFLSLKVILGAFLHDIGHLVGFDGNVTLMVTDGQILGTKDHEIVGANFLRQCGFDSQISDIVLHHVDAKRYLVYKNPLYFEGKLIFSCLK